MKHLFKILLLAMGLMACKGLHSIKHTFSNASPSQKYAQSLKSSGLAETAMGITWKEAGDKALKDSIVISLPFTESGFFQAADPEARSYRFEVKEGQVLTVKGLAKTPPNGKLFIDLFILKNGEWKETASADTSLNFQYEFEKGYTCLLRVQPELLINAYFTITLARTPVLINPVQGATNKSIGSFYGDARDNGTRKHEGVDIFAPRGTPILAPTDGHISRVTDTKIGGKVVWMFDFRRGHSYYFAHLDSQMVHIGQHVQQGDVLGTVGNTGNAISTPPHLHFGIYQTGTKDPLYYIHTLEGFLHATVLDTTFQSQAFKVNAKNAPLYRGPSKKSPVRNTLTKEEYVNVVGYSQDWCRVVLPNGEEGYVAKKWLSSLKKGTAFQLKQETSLLQGADENAIPMVLLPPLEEVELLAVYEKFGYVKTRQGLSGWLILKQAF